MLPVVYPRRVLEPLLGLLKLTYRNNYSLPFRRGGPTRPPLRFVAHLPPQLCEMEESQSNVGIIGGQRGALALHSFSAAQPNGLGLRG